MPKNKTQWPSHSPSPHSSTKVQPTNHKANVSPKLYLMSLIKWFLLHTVPMNIVQKKQWDYYLSSACIHYTFTWLWPNVWSCIKLWILKFSLQCAIDNNKLLWGCIYNSQFQSSIKNQQLLLWLHCLSHSSHVDTLFATQW